MQRLFRAACIALAIALAAPAAMAQQTTGNISGRIVDDQGAAVPGVTVTGKNVQTGFTRTDVSDGEGIYRLTALPVGTYDITAELQGFIEGREQGHRPERRPDARRGNGAESREPAGVRSPSPARRP